MKVTEQIDALVTLSTNPMKYLTVPRVVAATLAVPLLVAVGDAIGIMGGYLVGISRLGFNEAAYIKNTVDFLEHLGYPQRYDQRAVLVSSSPSWDAITA